MSTSTLIVLAVIVVVVLWVISIYNGLVAMRQRVNQAFADVDVQLRQRHDLVPNLVETVKGYAAHERGTLDEVVKARNAAVAAQGPAQQAAAENMLSGRAAPTVRARRSLSGPQGQRQFPAIAGGADRSREQDRGRAALLQQCGAGIQYRHPAFPRRPVRRRVRFRAEGILRSRRRAQDRRRSAASQVLRRPACSNRPWPPTGSTATSNRTGGARLRCWSACSSSSTCWFMPARWLRRRCRSTPTSTR